MTEAIDRVQPDAQLRKEVMAQFERSFKDDTVAAIVDMIRAAEQRATHAALEAAAQAILAAPLPDKTRFVFRGDIAAWADATWALAETVRALSAPAQTPSEEERS